MFGSEPDQGMRVRLKTASPCQSRIPNPGPNGNTTLGSIHWSLSLSGAKKFLSVAGSFPSGSPSKPSALAFVPKAAWTNQRLALCFPRKCQRSIHPTLAGGMSVMYCEPAWITSIRLDAICCAGNWTQRETVAEEVRECVG
jgi:hypothetical protein